MNNHSFEPPATTSTSRDYFDSMYSTDVDPWGFDHSWYEQRKYDITMAALPRARYEHALEPGCSNGALTERLAARCDRLVAFDFVGDVVERARRRLAGHDHVDVVDATFPTYWPDRPVDLVVWSEVAYYLDHRDADRAIDGLDVALAEGGDVIAVHYTGATDYPRRGTDIAGWLDGVEFLTPLVRHVDESFELGVWRRVSAG